MRATADGRANQHARRLGKLRSAKSYACRLARRQNPAPCTAPHRTAKHTSHSLHTYHALRPLPPTFDSSADPVLQHIRLARLTTRCKPPLLKVRLSIRGALNPLCPASAGPGQQAALHRALSPWPRLPGCPQDSCIRLPPPRLQKPSALPMLASVLAYGVFLSETQYPLWQLILAFWRTSGGAVYTTSRYTFP